MFIILQNRKNRSMLPEGQESGNHVIIQGEYIVRELTKNELRNGQLFIGEQLYLVDNNNVYTSKIQAKIICLKMELERMKQAGEDYFFPNHFKSKYNKLIVLNEEYPEFIL